MEDRSRQPECRQTPRQEPNGIAASVPCAAWLDDHHFPHELFMGQIRITLLDPRIMHRKKAEMFPASIQPLELTNAGLAETAVSIEQDHGAIWIRIRVREGRFREVSARIGFECRLFGEFRRIHRAFCCQGTVHDFVAVVPCPNANRVFDRFNLTQVLP